MLLSLKNLFFLTILLIISGCASIGSPSGGDIDKTSPKLISIFPTSHINIDDRQSIKLIFNERINPLSLKSYIRIEPSVDIYINARNNEIKISPIDIWPNKFKIFISRNISDYHGNSLNSPIELLYSKSDFIDSKKINGQLFNIDNSKIYEVALINKNYSIISKTESDNLGNFSFTGIEDIDSLFILAIEGSIKNEFKNSIRTHKYGLSNRDLNYDLNPIYISEPVFKAKVNNIVFLNDYYGKINLSDGNSIPLILNHSKFYNEIYNDNFLYIKHDFKDSLLIDFNYKNTIEEYNINSSIAFSKGIQDTLSPYIMDNFFSNDSLFFKFSEPISLNHNTEIFSFINKDSIKTNIRYKYLSPDLIFLDADNDQEITVNCLGISDLNYNNLCDTVLVVPKGNVDLDNNIKAFGTVNGTINYEGNEALIVEIVNTPNNDFIRKNITDNQFSFENLVPGEYKIWVYENTNNVSSNYFSGLLEPKIIKSAKFGIYPSNLTVRGNWVNTITINLE